jgi:Fic family protein
MEEDISAVIDSGEPIAQMEPMRIWESSRHHSAIADVALDLAQQSAAFGGSIPPGLAEPLAELVRGMNCYYSNLIEGHNTHPVSIEQAMRQEFAGDAKQRDLQREASAHVQVQAWLDGGGLRGQVMTAAGVREIHRRFCELLPEDLLHVEDLDGNMLTVQPGELRQGHVKVGRHVAISPGAVPRFMDRFEEVYGKLGRVESIVAAAAAHHRLVWIHPFLDGNGRVARLMSHAALSDVLQTGSVWSVARGLARSVDQYKQLLANCDLPRRNDLDGRGNLSEEALVEFTRYFLDTCTDQVTFMRSLMEPEGLRMRILLWAEEETRLGRLPNKAGSILEAILYRGQLARDAVAGVVGLGDRQARRIVSALVERGAVAAAGPRAPLRLRFPAVLAGRWMPNLFPEYTGE